MDRQIALITDINDLTGSNYFEIMLGKYDGNCWNANSIFFDEEVFTLIEKPFEEAIPKYDHYSFVEVPKEIIELLIKSLKELENTLKVVKKENIKNVLSWMFTTTFDDYINEYNKNLEKTRNIISELIAWLEIAKKSSECITILGM